MNKYAPLYIAELSLVEIDEVGGASHSEAEAFLLGAGIGAGIGGFAGGPFGAAAGCLIGGGLAVAMLEMD